MPMEHSAGTIIYRKGNYLLLHYEAGHWDFPKGHIEKGEYAWETAKREAFEETGIKDLFLVKGFKHMIEYFFKDKGEIIHKNVVLFLVETNTEKGTRYGNLLKLAERYGFRHMSDINGNLNHLNFH